MAEEDEFDNAFYDGEENKFYRSSSHYGDCYAEHSGSPWQQASYDSTNNQGVSCQPGFDGFGFHPDIQQQSADQWDQYGYPVQQEHQGQRSNTQYSTIPKQDGLFAQEVSYNWVYPGHYETHQTGVASINQGHPIAFDPLLNTQGQGHTDHLCGEQPLVGQNSGQHRSGFRRLVFTMQVDIPENLDIYPEIHWKVIPKQNRIDSEPEKSESTRSKFKKKSSVDDAISMNEMLEKDCDKTSENFLKDIWTSSKLESNEKFVSLPCVSTDRNSRNEGYKMENNKSLPCIDINKRERNINDSETERQSVNTRLRQPRQIEISNQTKEPGRNTINTIRSVSDITNHDQITHNQSAQENSPHVLETLPQQNEQIDKTDPLFINSLIDNSGSYMYTSDQGSYFVPTSKVQPGQQMGQNSSIQNLNSEYMPAVSTYNTFSTNTNISEYFEVSANQPWSVPSNHHTSQIDDVSQWGHIGNHSVKHDSETVISVTESCEIESDQHTVQRSHGNSGHVDNHNDEDDNHDEDDDDNSDDDDDDSDEYDDNDDDNHYQHTQRSTNFIHTKGQQETQDICSLSTILESLADYEGFEVHDVPADGNCMFAAVLDQLHISGVLDYSVKSLRHSAVSYLRKNPLQEDGTHLESFLQTDTWESYLTCMARNSVWGDHLILKALTELLGCRIVVMTANSDGQNKTILDPIHVVFNPLDTLYLGHIGECHFNSLRPKTWEEDWPARAKINREKKSLFKWLTNILKQIEHGNQDNIQIDGSVDGAVFKDELHTNRFEISEESKIKYTNKKIDLKIEQLKIFEKQLGDTDQADKQLGDTDQPDKETDSEKIEILERSLLLKSNGLGFEETVTLNSTPQQNKSVATQIKQDNEALAINNVPDDTKDIQTQIKQEKDIATVDGVPKEITSITTKFKQDEEVLTMNDASWESKSTPMEIKQEEEVVTMNDASWERKSIPREIKQEEKIITTADESRKTKSIQTEMKLVDVVSASATSQDIKQEIEIEKINGATFDNEDTPAEVKQEVDIMTTCTVSQKTKQEVKVEKTNDVLYEKKETSTKIKQVAKDEQNNNPDFRFNENSDRTDNKVFPGETAEENKVNIEEMKDIILKRMLEMLNRTCEENEIQHEYERLTCSTSCENTNFSLFEDSHQVDPVSEIPLPHLSFLLRNILQLNDIHVRYNYQVEKSVIETIGSRAEGLSYHMFNRLSIGKSPEKSKDPPKIIQFPKGIVCYPNELGHHNSDLIAVTKDLHAGYLNLQPVNSEEWRSMIVEDANKTPFLSLNSNTAEYKMEKSESQIFFSMRCPEWPESTSEWICRDRPAGWPEPSLMERIMNYGCHVIFKSHPQSLKPDIEWMFIFSKAERTLATEALTSDMKYCFSIFKVLVDYQTSKVQPKLSTNLLKTILFYACEVVSPSCWGENPAGCILYLVQQLLIGLKSANIPHYFIKENNMIDHFPENSIKHFVRKIEVLRTFPIVTLKFFGEHHSLTKAWITERVLSDIERYKEDMDIKRTVYRCFVPTAVKLAKKYVDFNQHSKALDCLQEVYQEILVVDKNPPEYQDFLENVIGKEKDDSFIFWGGFHAELELGISLLPSLLIQKDTVTIGEIVGERDSGKFDDIPVPQTLVHCGRFDEISFLDNFTSYLFKNRNKECAHYICHNIVKIKAAMLETIDVSGVTDLTIKSQVNKQNYSKVQSLNRLLFNNLYNLLCHYHWEGKKEMLKKFIYDFEECCQKIATSEAYRRLSVAWDWLEEEDIESTPVQQKDEYHQLSTASDWSERGDNQKTSQQQQNNIKQFSMLLISLKDRDKSKTSKQPEVD